MNSYQAIFSYLGTRYQGWQIQPGDALTVQGEILKALKKICKSSEVACLGSGRTDSGVHALRQVARLDLPFEIEASKLVKALNSHLPKDIRTLKAVSCPEDFHPILHAKNKTYEYYFIMGKEVTAILSDQLSHIKYELDLEQVRKCTKLFEGEFDFHNFQNQGTPVKTTVRKIFKAQFDEISPETHPFSFVNHRIYRISFTGSGFLKQMVRLMVGAIWEVGRGKIELELVEKSLVSPESFKIAPCAPPNGLYLKEVKYEA